MNVFRTGSSSSPAVSTPSRRKSGPVAERQRALRVLAGSPPGCTEAILLAHGFTVEIFAPFDGRARDGDAGDLDGEELELGDASERRASTRINPVCAA
jgi:hypothetical protein